MTVCDKSKDIKHRHAQLFLIKSRPQIFGSKMRHQIGIILCWLKCKFYYQKCRRNIMPTRVISIFFYEIYNSCTYVHTKNYCESYYYSHISQGEVKPLKVNLIIFQLQYTCQRDAYVLSVMQAAGRFRFLTVRIRHNIRSAAKYLLSYFDLSVYDRNLVSSELLQK